jgi:hypothetical protein
MPTITGLTKRQVTLLDTMWSMESTEQYDEWKSTQDASEIATLEQLMMLSVAEDEPLCLQDATKVLTNIMKI